MVHLQNILVQLQLKQKHLLSHRTQLALSGDITISQNSVGANGASAYVVDVNASASTIRVIDVTNGANASAGYDGKPGSFQCTTANSASGFGGVSAATISKFTYHWWFCCPN